MKRVLLVLAVLGGCVMGDDDSWPGFDGSSMSFPDGRALVDAQPVPDARMFPDSPPPVFPDAPPPVMCGTTSPDLCAAAMDVTAGAMAAGGMTVSGDTTSLMNDLSPPATGCTGFSNPGPDAIFQVTAAAGQTIRATVRPDLWDASVFIASACTSSACVAGADIEIDEPETTSFAVTTAGTYFVVVDSWQASTAGCYELNVALD